MLLIGWGVGSLVTGAHPGVDGAIVTGLHGSRTGALTMAMRAFTWLGSGVWLDVVFAVAVAALLIGRRRHSLVALVLASPGTVLMVQSIKALVGRARPPGIHLTPAGGASWPSGHASSSAALYGVLLLIMLDAATPRGRHARRTVTVLVSILLGLIGFSRVYLGVHYPSDVLAGWLLVGGWLTVVRCTFGVATDGHAPAEPTRSTAAPSALT
ncbi:MAG: hypothetical protein NVS3B18_15620 [Candidatus Dormibacteria bacterium]